MQMWKNFFKFGFVQSFIVYNKKPYSLPKVTPALSWHDTTKKFNTDGTTAHKKDWAVQLSHHDFSNKAAVSQRDFNNLEWTLQLEYVFVKRTRIKQTITTTLP